MPAEFNASPPGIAGPIWASNSTELSEDCFGLGTAACAWSFEDSSELSVVSLQGCSKAGRRKLARNDSTGLMASFAQVQES